eukprot:323640-Rhodomonas_salina.2
MAVLGCCARVQVKRLIGRAYSDSTVQKDIKSFPYLVKDKGGKPSIQIQWEGKTKTLAPEEVSAMVAATRLPLSSFAFARSVRR